MPSPTAERPPGGLDAYWLGVWRHALKVLKAQETWEWEQRPLLDEYVFALIGAKECRESGQAVRWDAHARRAALLADKLILTPEAKRKHGLFDEDEPEGDEFSELEDEVAKYRKRRAS